MSKLLKFTAELKYTSDLGNTFQDKYTTKDDANIALLATIEKMGFLSKVSGIDKEAKEALEKGFNS